MSELKQEKEKQSWIPSEHPWRCRLVVGSLMFILSFVGVGLTVLNDQRSWEYWKYLACIFSVLSLGLSAYLKHYRWKESLVTFWHEIVHWLGLIFATALLANMVRLGFISPFAASLQALVLLALATFLAGVYIEKTFLFIGLLMGLFALTLSYISLYTYLFFIPLSLIFVVGFYLFIRKKSHQMTMEKEGK